MHSRTHGDKPPGVGPEDLAAHEANVLLWADHMQVQVAHHVKWGPVETKPVKPGGTSIIHGRLYLEDYKILGPELQKLK